MASQGNPIMINEQDERRAEIREILLGFAAIEGAPIPSEARLNAAIERIIQNSIPYQTVNVSGRYEK